MTDTADRPSPVVLVVYSPLLGPSTWRRVASQPASERSDVSGLGARPSGGRGAPPGTGGINRCGE